MQAFPGALRNSEGENMAFRFVHGVSVRQFHSIYFRMVSISLPLCARYAGQLYGAVNEACT